MSDAQGNQAPRELQQACPGLIKVPVVPTDLVVLAVGVVVAALGAQDLIAAAQHGNPLRKKQRRQQVACLYFARPVDLRIIGRPLGAHVPRMVVVRAVLIVLAVGLVVLFVVADQIVQREAVMCHNEIYAGVGFAPVMLIQI